MDLTGARGKVARAEHHLRDARDIFKEWREKNIVWEYLADEMFAWSSWTMKVLESPPDELSLVFGDFFSNARAALDFVAWEIFRASNPGQKDEMVYFPIVRPGGVWASSRKIRNASQGHLELLRLAQDTPPSNMLFMLNEFANAQKHRTLHLLAMGADGETTFTLPTVPPGLEFVMVMNSDPTPLEPFTSHIIATYYFYSEESDVAAERPAGFEFARPNQPERLFQLTDGEHTLNLDHLAVQLEIVRKIVESFVDG